MKNSTILIVDDSIINLDILGDLLDEYDLIETTDALSALEILEEENVDLILLDIVMPKMNGYELCQKLKEQESTQSIPIIFITSKTDEDSIEKTFEYGGSDYVSKPFKPKELLSRVNTQLKLKQMEEELRILTIIDPMTKLYNRRYFSKVSDQIISFALRNKQELSLISIDIDDFKNINNTYGEKTGDEVIVSLSNLLLSKLRKSDIVCRYEGEEFVILLPNTRLSNTQIIAENIRKDVELLSISYSNSETVRYTVSLGISTLSMNKDKSIEKLLKRSDDALNHAKKSGKNRSYTI